MLLEKQEEGVPAVAQLVKDPVLSLWHSESIPRPLQWLKDPVLPQLWLRFNPWPKNFHMLWMKKKKKKKKNPEIRKKFLKITNK